MCMAEACWNEEDDDDVESTDFYDCDFDGFDIDEDVEDWSSDSSSDFEMQYGAGGDASDPSKLLQLICGRMYIIDLAQMTQTPRAKCSKMRKIMRCKASEPAPGVRGVAGLKSN